MTRLSDTPPELRHAALGALDKCLADPDPKVRAAVRAYLKISIEDLERDIATGKPD